MANLNHYFEDLPVEIKANMLFWIKAGEGKYTELSDQSVRFEGQLDVNAMGKKIEGPFEMGLKLESAEANEGKCHVDIKFQQYNIEDDQADFTATDDMLTVKATYKDKNLTVNFSKENNATVIKGDILPVTVKLDPK